MCTRIAWRVKLSIKECEFYRVKKGQTLKSIARAFSCPARMLAACNDLSEEVRAGEVLKIPKIEGNLYRVRGDENKSLLAGSDEGFEKKNFTRWLYPTQQVIL